MEGVRLTGNPCTRDPLLCAETLERILGKLLEDLVEAYHRTPHPVSSKPYIERGLRLAESGVTVSRMLVQALAKLRGQ